MDGCFPCFGSSNKEGSGSGGFVKEVTKKDSVKEGSVAQSHHVGRVNSVVWPRNKFKVVAKDLHAFSVDRSKFLARGVDGHLRIWEWPSLRIIIDEPRAPKSFRDMDFSLDSKFLASTCVDGSAQIWRMEDGVPLTSLVCNLVFEGAYKSQLSIVILDDIERLLEYVAIGPRFSNIISQTLLVLLKRLPPKGKKLLVIGTTSEVGFLDSISFCDTFSVSYRVPTLKTEDAKKVLQQLNVFAAEDVDAAAEALNDMPIKKLYMLIEMAAQGEQGGASDTIYFGKQKINIAHFYDCLQDVFRSRCSSFLL